MKKVSKKVVLTGHYGVGKTSLVRRFVHNKFSELYLTTIGVSIEKKSVELDAITLNLIIWDVAGEKDQRRVPESYFLGAHGIMYVFDLSRPSSWETLETDMENMKKKYPKVPVLVLGNKVDLLEEEALEAIKTRLKGKYAYLTSALSGEWVEEAFIDLGRKMI